MGILTHVRHGPLRAATWGFALMALGACASTAGAPAVPEPGDSTPAAAAPQDTDGFAYHAAELTVREGLKGITQRYIEPVNMTDLAVDGLRGLSTIEPGLQIEMDDKAQQVNMVLDGAQVAHFAAPGDADAQAWAQVATNVIQAGRDRSADLKNADNERVYEAMFDGMLSHLDTFSRYSGAEEASANRARRDGFGGIGIRFTQAGESILVTHVMEDTPASQAGLKPGDTIVSVDGVTVTGEQLRDVAKLLRGPVGSQILLTISRLGSEANEPERLIDFNLQRSHIVPETVRVAMQDGLLVFTVSSFNKNTASVVHDGLRIRAHEILDGTIKGVVMDLRGNPGGLLSQSVNVADLFLDSGRIISTRGRHPDSLHDYTASGVDLAHGLPLAILVDGDSASAAEIVASALQDLGRAVVVGSASYGKGTVQTVIRLPNDGEVTLTWSRLVSPSGYALHQLGVMPAVCATNTAAPPEKLDDAILAPTHIDAQRETMDAWRATGMIFDERRPKLRKNCPSKAIKADESGDLLMRLAARVITDPTLYKRAVMLSEPVNTASR